MISYLKFWLKSSNQHGLHSPFVYNYLTKGLYDSINLSSDKKINWMLKTIVYFNPNKIYVCESLKNLLNTFQDKFTSTITDADLIFIQNESFLDTEKFVLAMGDNQLLLICNNKYNESYQSKLRVKNEIVIVIDFYYGSLISKRKEQLKQNFFLRL